MSSPVSQGVPAPASDEAGLARRRWTVEEDLVFAQISELKLVVIDPPGVHHSKLASFDVNYHKSCDSS